MWKKCSFCVFVTILLALQWTTASSATAEEERNWTIILEDIFRDGTKPLYIYCREKGGQFISAVGSSRDPDRMGGKTYNRSWYYADLSKTPIVDGRMRGTFTLHITPDLWVPLDHKGYTIDFEIDARVTGDGKMSGSYQITAINTKDASTKNFGRKGSLAGTSKPFTQPPLPEPLTLRCNMQGALVGGDPAYGGRCMILWLGLEKGKLTSTIHGLLSQKHEPFSRKGFSPSESSVTVTGREKVTARIVVPTVTLDMEPCKYIYDIKGWFMDQVFLGTYDLTVEIAGKEDVKIAGSFDGGWSAGVTHMETDERPWSVPVRGFKAPAPGEHPRLLFRKSEISALRKKAQTTEGKAIIERLRYLLNGSDGESMTKVFSKATHAYMGGGYRNTTVDTPGVYTIGHAAGYGMLYQLTGDKRYAQYGKECFEKALSGVRDRDDRYSFKKPGGALRAGPSLGWYAVGYDLCYDGWDTKTREKMGRAMIEFVDESGKKKIDIEALARSTMPPASNHFGMQIGGASLVLLAVTGEKWVDQEKVDTLLSIAEQSMMRNVSEGFGDGGFFAEGDGTGSMASQIAYLAAVQAWKNAAGKDFVNSGRPNVRMTTLKWLYQTVYRDGRPDFWPIRGSYGHNVWAREGLSGGGYFAFGFGGVADNDRAAMRWAYNEFLLDRDKESVAPYDTISRYPHQAVCALVNWPTGIRERNPADVLPHCYRDSHCGFYAWRNRWKDSSDTVITVLTNRTQGYMSAKTDRQFMINAGGQHLRWGTVKEGNTKHWSTSPRGQTSSLTMSDGTCLGVDFSGASGADTMLVTTGSADGQKVKVGSKTLTFYFPTADNPPKVSTQGSSAVVGHQKVSLEDGNIVFGNKGR